MVRRHSFRLGTRIRINWLQGIRRNGVELNKGEYSSEAFSNIRLRMLLSGERRITNKRNRISALLIEVGNLQMGCLGGDMLHPTLQKDVVYGGR